MMNYNNHNIYKCDAIADDNKYHRWHKKNEKLNDNDHIDNNHINIGTSSCPRVPIIPFPCGSTIGILLFIFFLVLIGIIIGLAYSKYKMKKIIETNMNRPIKDILKSVANNININPITTRFAGAGTVENLPNENLNAPHIRWYTADWCGYCKLFGNKTWEPLKNKLSTKVAFSKFDCTDQRISEIISKIHTVRDPSVPGLLFNNTNEENQNKKTKITGYPFFTIEFPNEMEEKLPLSASSSVEQWTAVVDNLINSRKKN